MMNGRNEGKQLRGYRRGLTREDTEGEEESCG